MKPSIVCFLIICIFLVFCVLPSTYTGGIGSTISRLEGPAYTNESPHSAAGAQLRGTIDSTFVPQSKNSCNGTSPAWDFKVTVAEIGGVGATIQNLNLTFYDNNFNQIGSRNNTGAEFAGFVANCGPGSNRIPAFAQVCANLCVGLNGRQSGYVALTISGTSDDGFPTGACFPLITLLGPDRTQGADLSITNSSSAGEVPSGALLVYSIKVANAGPETATGVTVTDSVPTGTTFNAVAISQGGFTAPPVGGNGVIACSLGAIPSGSSALVWLVVKVTAQPGTQIKNTASVVGTLSDPNPSDNVADETVSVAPELPGLPKSDLSVTSTASSESAAPGEQVTYNITVRNAGPDAAAFFTLFDILPVGTTFSSISASRSGFITPRVGSSGAIIGGTGLLAGESFTIAIKVNVLTPAGSVLMNKVEIIDGSVGEKFPRAVCSIPLQLSGSDDPNDDNNTAVDRKSVRGGGLVELSWVLQPSTLSDPTPAPRDLRVNPASSAFANSDIFGSESLGDTFVFPQATCTLQGFNIYQSNTPLVQTIPANLVKIITAVGAAFTAIYKTNIPVAAIGSFYAVTAVWRCSTSNEVETNPGTGAGVPGGPALEEIEVSSRLTIRGKGFSDPLEIFVDGVRFKKPARLKNESVVIQKGPLLGGKSVAELLGPGKTPLLTIRNSNGGISSTLLTAQ
ncbi:MAG: DUF11 domain-containing protein [Acidobacteriota bacterium]